MNAHAFDLTRTLIVDSFAGGGGASTGIEMALGRSPDIAINHNAAALALHQANHPHTLHLSKNIWQVDPLEAVRGRPVGLACFSPDCKHFSKAKGGKPVKRNIRDLAWTVVLWAKRARPAVIILENVEEFQDWGPLIEKGEGRFVPCPDRRGETFKRWVGDLKRLGYKVGFRQLVAADYGAPTTRKRFFMIARRDGLPIVWPEPTHGKPSDPAVIEGRKLPWRTAAEIIDWSLPCPSIFETSAKIFAKHGVRAVRPLAEATMARVARGTMRYVLDAADPFIVKFQTGSTGHAIDEPLHTVTANSFIKRPGGAAPLGLVVPVMTAAQHGGSLRAADEPMRTIAASAKDQHAIIAPHLSTMRNAQKPFNEIDKPTHTITAGGAGIALVAPTLIQTGYGERDGQAPRALDIEAPLGTVVAGGVKHALVASFLAQHNTGLVGHDAREPVSTIVGKGCTQGVVAAHLLNMKGSARASLGADEPVPTICASTTHASVVAAFMVKYYGTGDGQVADDPLATVTTRDRFGLVTVSIGGEDYVIDDIGLRMLTPRELFNAQGFPADYIIDGVQIDGRTLSKAEQISCCGNSVCPPLAAALVRANCVSLVVTPELEAAE